MPVALGYLWGAFLRLSSRRGSGAPITWGDLDAFQRLSGMRLAPWEVETIEGLDDLRREQV